MLTKVSDLHNFYIFYEKFIFLRMFFGHIFSCDEMITNNFILYNKTRNILTHLLTLAGHTWSSRFHWLGGFDFWRSWFLLLKVLIYANYLLISGVARGNTPLIGKNSLSRFICKFRLYAHKNGFLDAPPPKRKKIPSRCFLVIGTSWAIR